MFSGWTAFRSEYPGRIHAANAHTPFLVYHGTRDGVVLPDCVDVTERVLRDSGVPALVTRLPMAHEVQDRVQFAALQAFLEHLPPQGTAPTAPSRT